MTSVQGGGKFFPPQKIPLAGIKPETASVLLVEAPLQAHQPRRHCDEDPVPVGAALATVAITSASAQLVGGGGGLTGGLGGSLSGNLGGSLERSVTPTLDRVRDGADTSVRSARRGSGEVTAERSVDRRSGRVRAGGSARGDDAADSTVQALGGTLGGAGSLSGAASGSGSGSAGNGSASGSGEGALSLMGSGALPALNPGSMVRDAIGRVQSVRRNAAGKVEAVMMAVGRLTATLPADNFHVQGDVLVSAMGEGQVTRAAKGQAE